MVQRPSSGPRPPYCWWYNHCQLIHTALGRTPLDEWLARRGTSNWQHTTPTTDRYPCPPAAFEPTIPASERPQTHALDRAATGIGKETFSLLNISRFVSRFERAAGYGSCESLSPPTFILLTVNVYANLTSLVWGVLSENEVRYSVLGNSVFLKNWTVMNYLMCIGPCIIVIVEE